MPKKIKNEIKEYSPMEEKFIKFDEHKNFTYGRK
jgi:hypothetical protein